MEIPKTLWLKNHMEPSLFSRCQFFDLPDFLTYRATTDSTRSCCSVTCKCSFVPKSGWQADFFEKIGLEELVKTNYKQLGAANGEVLTAGKPVGNGLSQQAAEELGLVEGTPVGSAVIDAYVRPFLLICPQSFVFLAMPDGWEPSQGDTRKMESFLKLSHLLTSPDIVSLLALVQVRAISSR